MSAITLTQAPATRAPTRTATAIAARIGWTVSNWIRRQVAVQYNRVILRSLSDGALADIGIERQRIDDIIAERLARAGRPRGPYPF